MLFSNKERMDQDGARPGERQFAYLDRSGRPEAERVRTLLEKWLAEFPEPDREELRPRLQTDDDIAFLAAFSEMYFHALLRRIGYTVEVHPTPPSGSDKRPDFLAVRDDETQFYVEVALATDASAADAGARARADVVLDTLDRLESPNFFLDVRLRGAPSTPPRGKKLRRSLARWLSGLNPDVISEMYAEEGWASLPRYAFSHDGWRIDFVAVPKSPRNRGRPDFRPIGAQMYAPQESTPEVSVRTSVAGKATRYGELDAPYVVAVNLGTRFADHDTFSDALFGTLGITAAHDGGPTGTRDREGIWYGPGGPQNTRVSAVWGLNALDSWTVARRDACVYHNPWAARPLDPDLIPVSYGHYREGLLVVIPRSHPREIHGLSEEWPE